MDPVIINLEESSSSADNSDMCDEEEFSNDDVAQELQSD
jgi:hypothetical protein